MPKNLRDRVLIVTGASSGIGAATAIACAQAGMHVVLHGRDAPRLAATAEQVRRHGRTAMPVVGDVTQPGLSARLLEAARQCFGGFDVVFANAGYGFKKPTHELSRAELREIFEVNFFAAQELLCEAARSLLAEHRPGHLLMCSSAVAKFTMRNFGAYSATKAAQNHFCRAMRMELRPHGIEVSSVHPITTRTAFFERAAAYTNQATGHGGRSRSPQDWFVQSPQHVARAIVRCLQRPQPEVWTSFTVRLAAGLMTVFPRLMDVIGTRA